MTPTQTRRVQGQNQNGSSADRREIESLLTVGAVKSSKRKTIVFAEDGTQIELRPYIYLLPGNVLRFWPSKDDFKEVHKLVRATADDVLKSVRVYPPYSKSSWVHVPPHKFMVTFRERGGPKDHKAIKSLEQFHYRGKGLNRLIGRRTVLIAESHEHGVIGYGVLSSTLGAAKPRFTLFNTNFTKQMRTKLINRLVRIPRVVIHPEFRGMGLGAMMAHHLVDYARDYWDVRGYTPIAVEVIASMTEYHRFFEAAGFIRAGETQGYERGIMPLYGTGTWSERPNSPQYDFLHDQKPKPYLIYALNESVRGALMDQGLLHTNIRQVAMRPKPQGSRIAFRRLSAEYKTSNSITPRAKEVKDAFDVDARQMQSPVLKNFSLGIDPGDVVLVTGASGSGKSTVLKLLTGEADHLNQHMEMRGDIIGLEPQMTARLTTKWDDTLPLIDQIGESVKEAIEILNSVGLAEAHLYVKRPSQISDGQRYRFAVALLCDSKKPVWVADEFASSLDPLTAAIVAKGLRKRAYHAGATLVIAAAHVHNFVDSLLPNKLVTLRWGGMAEVVSLNCQFRILPDSIRLSLKNTSRQVMTGVEVLGVGGHGERELIATTGDLSVGMRRESIELPLDRVQKFNSLVVSTRQNVGDVFYFGHPGTATDRSAPGGSLV